MSLRRCLLGVILVAAAHGIMGGPLIAQDSDVDEAPSLSRGLVQSSAVLTESQREEIDDYVAYWIEQLKGSTDQQVPAARVKIEQPFNDPSASRRWPRSMLRCALSRSSSARRCPVTSRA